MGAIPAILPAGNAVLGDNPAPAAAAYAALGLAVFPVHGVDTSGRCSCGKGCGSSAGKHPRTVNGLLDATLDPDQIRTCWHRWPAANIGIATGAASGLWVLDVDPAHGGLESIERLEAVHGELAPTWCVETGGDGLHLWFLLGEAGLRNSAGRLGPGLDVRAEGGYVIVPPSRHRSGQAYRWADGWHPALVALVPAPPWLLALAGDERSPHFIPPDGSPIERKAGGNHFRTLPEVIAEGARNAALTSLAGAMRRKGCTEAAIAAALQVENQQRCRPPLPASEVAKIAQSVGRYAPEAGPTPVSRRSRPQGFVEIVNGRVVDR